MPEASLGFISTSLDIERTSKQFCGPDDSIKGTVTFTYRNAAEAKKGQPVPGEIFGPFRANVILEGRLRATVVVDNTTIARRMVAGYREDRLLFRSAVGIHDGSFRLERNGSTMFPFSMTFPDYADPRLLPGREEEGIARALEELPPSLSTDTKGPGDNSGNALVVYRMFVEAEMPGLDVEIRLRDGRHELVYRPTGASGTLGDEKSSFERTFSIQKRDLCTDVEKPNVFKAIMLREIDYPKFKFTVRCMGIPMHIRLGQSIQFQIRIEIDEESTVESPPDVSLKHLEPILHCATKAHAWSNIRQEQGSFYRGYLGQDKETPLGYRVSPKGAFWSGGSRTKTVETSPVTDVLCNFEMENVAMTYQLRLFLLLDVAKETFSVNKAVPIVIHGPLDQRSEESGLGCASIDASMVDEELPAYTAEPA